MLTRSLLTGLALYMLLLSCGCAGGRSSGAPIVEPAGAGAQAGAAGATLPALDKLPAPQRGLSIIGPGFFALPLDEMVARHGVTGGPGTLTLDGGAATAYVVYGVFGFDGDNGPTSARITTSSVSGQYFVAFSDYVGGVWQMAGPYTGSTEAEIPNTNAYLAAGAFTSPKGTCYLAVLCGPGDSLTLTGVELGVQGGVLGPQPPLSFSGDGEAPGFFLAWDNSSSYHDPDFAGYILQRAPQFGGSFSDLNPDVLKVPYFNDTTAAQDVLYRYRVCAQDASGNRSIWRNTVDGPVTAEKSPPVLQMDMPLGPLNGPSDVTFDLGGSFDPEGEGITTYTVSFATGPAPVSGASPLITVTLQPGCYMILAAVECAGPPARTASNMFRLVVYPRWQAAPVVVRDPSAPALLDLRRLQRASGTLNTTASRLTFCGFDMSNYGLCFRSAPASDPTAMALARLPIYMAPTGASEAFDVGASSFFAYSTAEALLLAQFDGAVASQQIASATPVSGKVAAAYDGSQIWAFYDESDGVNTNLQCVSFGTGSTFTVVPATGTLTAIDAQYNPATDTIDIVYGGSIAGTTEWARLDTASAAVVNSANLDPAAAALDIDLELDPLTGRPLVLYTHTSIHRFRELDAFNVWTPEVQVDNSVANFIPLDLIVDDGTRYAYFKTGPIGQAVLYRDDGASWSAVNTVAFSTDSALEVALVPQPDSPDRALVLDMDFSRDFHLAQLHDDGTDTDIWQLPHSDGQGFDLQAAAGTDGLHAVWRSISTLLTRHALSADGATWVDPGDIGAGFQDLGLAADGGGDVYFSCSHFGNAELYWWDGAALNLRSSFPNSSAHRPFLSQPPDGSLAWCAYDDATTTMHYVDVDEPVYTDDPVVMTTAPIWEGVANTLGTEQFWFGVVGGASVSSGSVNWSSIGDNSAAMIYDPLLDSSFNIYGTPLTMGRTFASTTYYGSIPVFPEQAMFCMRGRLINPTRYIVQSFESPVLDEIIIGKDYTLFGIEDLFSDDVRNTVSCALGNSATGLVLISSGDGARSYFAWSRYGEWEELPLPAGLDHLSLPQLVVGMDGRWHIIYKNWATDQMMCLSSL